MIITKENILKYRSGRDIIEYYLGKIDMRKNYKNPIRYDNKPSGRFYISNITNQIYFKTKISNLLCLYILFINNFLKYFFKKVSLPLTSYKLYF